MLEGYSVGARRVVDVAHDEARELGHSRVGTEHLLLGLLSDQGSEAAETLRVAGATLSAARFTVAEVATEVVESTGDDELPFSPRAQRALERAGRFARRDREPEVTTEHVLLGVLDVEGLGCQVMRGLGVDIVRLRGSLVGTATEPAPIDDAQLDEQAVTPPVRPRCSSCGVDLAANAAETVVSVQRDDGSVTEIGVVHCGICGTVLGVLKQPV